MSIVLPSYVSNKGFNILSLFRSWPLLLLLFIIVLAVFGDRLGYEANILDDMAILKSSSLQHLLGTDDMGRDVLARLAFGARISLLIAITTACFSVGFGAAYGVVCALAPKWLDRVLTSFMDILYSLPFLMVVAVFKLILTPSIEVLQHYFPSILFLQVATSIFATILALAFFSWTDTARLIRAETQKIIQEEYVEAAQNIGTPPWYLFVRHLIPNLSGFLLLSITMTVPRAILTEATLSFLGLGIQPPWCTWGTMILDGWQMIRIAPLLLVWPSLCLMLTVVCLNQLTEQFKQRFKL